MSKDTVGKGNEGPALDAYTDAVATLYERGETDLLEGGVRPETVADEFGVAADTARHKLLILRKRGHLEEIWGVGPNGPRKGFKPTDEQ